MKEREAWTEFNRGILSNPNKVIQGTGRLSDAIGYVKNIDGKEIVTYVFNQGKDAGYYCTTVLNN